MNPNQRSAVRYLQLVFPAVLLVSCRQERDRCTAYHFHRTFPAAYQGSAKTAMERWSIFSRHVVDVEDGDADDTACSFRAISSSSDEYKYILNRTGLKSFFAYHEGDDGSLLIAEDVWAKDPYCVDDRAKCALGLLMHEIGHEYWLQHVQDPEAVMCPDSTVRAMWYNHTDRDECVRVGTCD